MMKVVGCDVFVICEAGVPSLPENNSELKAAMISNRGTKVWPGPLPEIEMVDVHRCRFVAQGSDEVSSKAIVELLNEIEKLGYPWVHVEKLLEFDGQAGFSKAQGE